MIRLDGGNKEVSRKEMARREKSKKIRNSLKIKIGTYNSGDAIKDLVKLADDIRSKMTYYSEEDSRLDSGKFYKALYKVLTGTDASEIDDDEEINMSMSDYHFKNVDITKYGLSEDEGVVPYGFYWDTFNLSPLRCYIDSDNCDRIMGFVRNDTVDKLCEIARVSKEYDEVLFLLCLYQLISFRYVISKTGRVDFVSSRIANLHNGELDYGTDGYKRVFLFEGAAYWYTTSICVVALRDNASLEKYMLDFICALKMIKDPSVFSTNLYRWSKGFRIGDDVDFSGLGIDTSSMLCLVMGFYDYICSTDCEDSLAKEFAKKIEELLFYGYDCSNMKKIVGVDQFGTPTVCFIPSFAICVIEEYLNKGVVTSNRD